MKKLVFAILAEVLPKHQVAEKIVAADPNNGAAASSTLHHPRMKASTNSKSRRFKRPIGLTWS